MYWENKDRPITFSCWKCGWQSHVLHTEWCPRCGVNQSKYLRDRYKEEDRGEEYVNRGTENPLAE